jgi:hypothetical protein
MFIAPNPLVSRGKPVFSGPSWVAANIGVGPARVLVRWGLHADDGAAPGAPAEYRLETSASSRDGLDGEWRVEVHISDNLALARAHDIEFDGQSWVRLSVPGEASTTRLKLGVFDATDGTDDSWLILGDELGARGLEQVEGEPGYAELIHEAYPGYTPALVNEARAGEQPESTLARLESLLAVHPHVRHVALVYGAAGAAALEPLVLALLDAKRVPSIASCSEGDEVAALVAQHGLVPGPDLRAWFGAQPEQLGAGQGLTPEGRRAVHRLWAEAMDVFYVPQ